MKFLGLQFEYKTRHFTVVIITMTIMIALLALGFGLASARSVSPTNGGDESNDASNSLDIEAIKAKLENSTLFETSYERAIQILSKYPIVDG